MITKILYAVVIVLAVLVAARLWTVHSAYGGIERAAAEQAYGAADKQAKVTIIALTDYACRPCKDSHAVVLQAVSESADTRLVFVPLAGDSTVSATAARVAMAAGQQGAFAAMHDLLMRNEKPLTEDTIRNLAGRIRLDAGRLLADMQGDAVTGQIVRQQELAARLPRQAMPTLIFNRRMVYTPQGDMPAVYVAVRTLIKQAR